MDFQLPPVEENVPSPCTQVCTLDLATDVCLGCGRTRAEIEAWTRLDAEAKRRVIAAAVARRSHG